MSNIKMYPAERGGVHEDDRGLLRGGGPASGEVGDRDPSERGRPRCDRARAQVASLLGAVDQGFVHRDGEVSVRQL